MKDLESRFLLFCLSLLVALILFGDFIYTKHRVSKLEKQLAGVSLAADFEKMEAMQQSKSHENETRLLWERVFSLSKNNGKLNAAVRSLKSSLRLAELRVTDTSKSCHFYNNLNKENHKFLYGSFNKETERAYRERGLLWDTLEKVLKDELKNTEMVWQEICRVHPHYQPEVRYARNTLNEGWQRFHRR